MSDTELKPCPFCGSEAYTEIHWLEGTWSAGCQVCNAQMPYVGLTEAEAITAWNTRQPDPQVTALVEACRAVVASAMRNEAYDQCINALTTWEQSNG